MNIEVKSSKSFTFTVNEEELKLITIAVGGMSAKDIEKRAVDDYDSTVDGMLLYSLFDELEEACSENGVMQLKGVWIDD